MFHLKNFYKQWKVSKVDDTSKLRLRLVNGNSGLSMG